MSDDVEDGAGGLVPVTLGLPVGLLGAYDALVEERIYPDRGSALLHGLVESWRHNRGSFHTFRLDLVGGGADRDDDRAEASDDMEPGGKEG